MKEIEPTSLRHELWYDGPNYTADSVIINPASQKILLIKRSSGEWALPGGFIDPGEDSLAAAIRETREETGVTISDGATLIFRGLVDDPRNRQESWIETSAYLFTVSDTIKATGHDDAIDAGWRSIDNLPSLYASHDYILTRALDHLSCQNLIEIAQSPETYHDVSGGHMQYDKIIATKNGQSVFVKQISAKYDDTPRRNRLHQYLEKEAFVMAHLRSHGYSGIPERSILHGSDTLIMDAMEPDGGWQWRARKDTLNSYVNSAIEKFNELESMPLPADAFDIEPSRDSFVKEGWQSIDNQKIDKLHKLAPSFLDRLTPRSQAAAQSLLRNLASLRQIGSQTPRTNSLVFCHHDIRQSNMAWHPNYGTRLVDWSWSGLGESGSDITSLLIDLHKSYHDISPYQNIINLDYCLTLMGFWLNHATWPHHGDDTTRFQQFLSALSAYEIYING